MEKTNCVLNNWWLYLKGTQSLIINEEYCLCYLATNDMLRVVILQKLLYALNPEKPWEMYIFCTCIILYNWVVFFESLYLTKSDCIVSQGQLSDDLVVGIINEALEKLLHQQRLYSLWILRTVENLYSRVSSQKEKDLILQPNNQSYIVALDSI